MINIKNEQVSGVESAQPESTAQQQAERQLAQASSDLLHHAQISSAQLSSASTQTPALNNISNPTATDRQTGYRSPH